MERMLHVVRRHSSLSPRKAEVRHRHPLNPEQWEAPSPTSPRWACHVWAGGCGFITQHEAHPFPDPPPIHIPPTYPKASGCDVYMFL